MPTGSYDSSVVSTFVLARQPLNLYSDNIGAVPFAYQPLNIVVNVPFIYVAPPAPPPPPVNIISFPSANNVIEISVVNSNAPEMIIFSL